jgi:diacylglycerol kinase family enzyme
MVFSGSGKIRTLMICPSIFKGEHIKNDKVVKVFRGKDISVKFDRPVALQIDGEPILGVTEYSAKACIEAPTFAEI